MAGAEVWGRFTLDPRDERHGRLRASDRDRDVANEVLGAAYADGRLTPAELDERTSAVAESKTLGELPALIDDLVVPGAEVGVPARPRSAVPFLPGRAPVAGVHRAEAERRYAQLRLAALMVFLLPTLICWVVWSALRLGGVGEFPWPVFPTLGTSIPLILVVATHRDIVSGTELRLERRQRRHELRRARREQRYDRREFPPPATPPKPPATRRGTPPSPPWAP